MALNCLIIKHGLFSINGDLWILQSFVEMHSLLLLWLGIFKSDFLPEIFLSSLLMIYWRSYSSSSKTFPYL